MGFLLAHLLLILGWSLVNLHVIPWLKLFDPFPFVFSQHLKDCCQFRFRKLANSDNHLG